MVRSLRGLLLLTLLLCACRAQPAGRLEHLIPDAAERARVRATLRLIELGGPYANRQDDTVFGNREGRLPRQPYGYYHEYTVPTPGARTRGARRLIRGRAAETYYTSDHYRTFLRLDR